jgi:hypothetical protein
MMRMKRYAKERREATERTGGYDVPKCQVPAGDITAGGSIVSKRPGCCDGGHPDMKRQGPRKQQSYKRLHITARQSKKGQELRDKDETSQGGIGVEKDAETRLVIPGSRNNVECLDLTVSALMVDYYRTREKERMKNSERNFSIQETTGRSHSLLQKMARTLGGDFLTPFSTSPTVRVCVMSRGNECPLLKISSRSFPVSFFLGLLLNRTGIQNAQPR